MASNAVQALDDALAEATLSGFPSQLCASAGPAGSPSARTARNQRAGSFIQRDGNQGHHGKVLSLRCQGK